MIAYLVGAKRGLPMRVMSGYLTMGFWVCVCVCGGGAGAVVRDIFCTIVFAIQLDTF